MQSVLSRLSPSNSSTTDSSQRTSSSSDSSDCSASPNNSRVGITTARSQHVSLVPPHWQDVVREIGISECRQAGLSLSHAFASDDLSKYLLDANDMAHHSDETRWQLHVFYMTGLVAAHACKGLVTTIGLDYDAVALWLPPGQDMDGWWTTVRSGLWKLFFKLSREGRRRYFGELLPVLHDTKLEVMGERDNDCYYLVYLGTKPSGRRKGYAGKLLEHMIAKRLRPAAPPGKAAKEAPALTVQADAEQRAMYLESSLLANNAYYQKFGFEIRKDIWIGKDGNGLASPVAPVRLTIMVREPRPIKDAN